MNDNEETSEIDYGALMDGVLEMREAVNALVVGLMRDGFSEEQARDIVVGLFRMSGRRELG